MAEPCQETEYQPHYEDLETNRGKLTACTNYVYELKKRLRDKEIQLAASQRECQETDSALRQAETKLARQQEQVGGCRTKSRALAKLVVEIQESTVSMIKDLAEDVDRQMAGIHIEISELISQFPSPPGTPEPPSVIWEAEGTIPQPKQMEPGPSKPGLAENVRQDGETPEEHTPEEHPPEEEHTNEHGNQLGIDHIEEPDATSINKDLVLPTNNTWQSLLESSTEATETNPDLGDPATKVVDVRIIQQAPRQIRRGRRRKDPKTTKTAPVPNADEEAPMPHIIKILKRTHITEPEPPTAEVRENGQAGSPDEPSPAQLPAEQSEDEASDWEEFVPPKESSTSQTAPSSVPQNNIDPSDDVIVKDKKTQKTYVELKNIA